MRIAGIDIGGTSVKMGVFDTGAGLVHMTKAPTGKISAAELTQIIADYVKTADVEMCGVGTAGNVDTTRGTVTADNLRWTDVPLRDMLTEATGQRVWVDNDANAALMAEWYDGACRGADTAVYLTLGTGVGGAVIINGKPWRGHTNTACEFGHIITHADGLKCACSRRGCLEAYASAPALLRYAGVDSVADVLEGLSAGDEAVSNGLKTYVHELGLGVISLIMTFNPEVFVLGGGLAALGGQLLTAVRNEVYGAFSERPDYFLGNICLAKHGNDAGMIGAALTALEMGDRIQRRR